MKGRDKRLGWPLFFFIGNDVQRSTCWFEDSDLFSFQVIDLFIDFNCVCFAMKLDPLSKSRISIVQA
jgi:hypothetical protein